MPDRDFDRWVKRMVAEINRLYGANGRGVRDQSPSPFVDAALMFEAGWTPRQAAQSYLGLGPKFSVGRERQ